MIIEEKKNQKTYLFKSRKKNVQANNKSCYENVIDKLKSHLIFVKKNDIIYKNQMEVDLCIEKKLMN